MAKRQLSAIMFTDLAGYTAMMQEDEFNAIGIRSEHREILEQEVAEYNGEILQYYGDGALTIFNSTISAANASLSIQKKSIAKKIPLRIGIHTGDVVIDDEGVYGDGVNIASRIESFSVPGSVMISEKVYDDIKNHQYFSPLLMGEFDLKNVKKPVEVYALSTEGLIVPQRTELQGKVRDQIKSIAVLPFINRSNDPENEYFSDGITEEIISALAKVEGLKVISRTSSFAFKGKNQDIRKIGKDLQVQSILEGSVRKAGNKVRITAQLSSTFDGYELWSEKYDRLLEDIFELQDEIAHKISVQLRERLGTNVNEQDNEAKKIDPEAFNHYLKGLFHYNKWTPAEADVAVNCFKQAIDLVPEFDQAYAGLAQSYSLLSTTGYLNPETGYQLCESSARKALEINPANVSAIVSLSFVQYFYRWDFEQAINLAKRSLMINPLSPDGNMAISLYYMIYNDHPEAIKFMEKAREIDPLSLLINRTVADTHYFKREYAKAIQVYNQMLEIDPGFLSAVEFKGWAYLMDGDYDQAIYLFKSLDTNQQVHTVKPFVQLGYAHAMMGDFETAEFYLQQLINEAETNPTATFEFDFAILYTGLQRFDQAIEYLRKCMDKRIGAMVFLHVSPIWDDLQNHPEFIKIKKEIGLMKG